ncbi:MAG: prephenate dehydrogenase/arogenate dehydrogenase family protein [Chloroflexi bacterium]|nr:prephenate dehydrogenase/arogenate dehydrogenase family protein [Chloroflexota bacterium]
MQKITIVGLGLIGSSLGMALKARAKDVEVTGYDVDSKAHNRAQKDGAVHKSEWRLPDAVRDADIVVLAVPVGAMKELFTDLAPHLKQGATVTDTATTKRQVTQWAMEMLPGHAGFVGGNPLAGGGKSGPDSARADLFVDATYAILPTPKAPESSVRAVVQMVEAIGAKPFFVDLHEHDTAVAAVSHLPILLSSALMMATASSPSWREIVKFAADDFKSMTSLSGVDPEVSIGVSSSNADMLVHWVDEIIRELNDLRAMMIHESRSDRDGPLMKTFVNAWEARKRYEAGVTMTEFQRPAVPTASEGMWTMFLGERLSRAFRRYGEEKEDPTKYRGH